MDEVKESFYSVVDEYLEDCAKEGVEPKKPFSGQFITRLKPILHQKLFIQAKKAGKSMNAFVEETLEEKLSARFWLMIFLGHYNVSIGADSLGMQNLQFPSRIVVNAIVAGAISQATGGKFANGAMSAAFRVAFNDSLGRAEAEEQDDRNKDYLDFIGKLNKSEKRAFNKALIPLNTEHRMDEFHGSARQNNVLGIGIFEVGDSFEFSDVSASARDGVLENSPTGASCFVVCRQSLGNAKGLRFLIFRHPQVQEI